MKIITNVSLMMTFSWLLVSAPIKGQELEITKDSLASVPDYEVEGASEMALKMQNPLATTTVLRTDNDILFNTGDDDTSYSFEFQPSYAFELPKRTFTFITRALVPLIGAAPEANFPTLGDPRPPGDSTTWGLSDIITQFFVTPKTHASWKGSVGPQFSWKTRTDDDVGGPGWGAGPVAIGAGPLTKQLYFAGTVSHLCKVDPENRTG